jgi:protein-tyrosine-phosphatase
MRILFVCLHGSAKSVIAAAHANRLARGRVEASSAGLEPDPAIPQQVVDGLAADGMHVPETPPRGLTR